MKPPVDQLNPRVASAVYGRFASVNDCQQAVIEPIIAGENLVLSSGTGSGKTEAVIAPLLHRHWKAALQEDCLKIVYVAPTKALINDLEARLSPVGNALGLRVGIRHGERDDITAGKKPHLLLTTPESLDVLLFRKDQWLASVATVVIDEVHLLYNTQRGLQLAILLRRLQLMTARPLQWVALSATIGRLSDIRDFIMRGTEAVLVACATRRRIDAYIEHIPSETAFLELIGKLVRGRPTKLLIFANARSECERLAAILARDEKVGRHVVMHYSSLSPEVRLETEKTFAASKTAICIATSTLELGIDIGNIDAAILWGTPRGIESFLQRVGRSNRRSSKTNVICLVPDNSSSVLGDALRFAALTQAAGEGRLPVRAPFDLFGAVGQQCLSIIASNEGEYTRITDLANTIDGASALNREDFEDLLAELAHQHYLRHHGFKNRYGAGEKLYDLVDYRLIYGNFGFASQTVDLYVESKLLGSVPATNLLRLHVNMLVRFNGKTWHVKKASPEGIILRPAKTPSGGMDISYSGSYTNSDAFLANQIWHLLFTSDFSSTLLGESLRRPLIHLATKLKSVTSVDSIPFFRSPTGIHYFTYGGYLVNKAIGHYSQTRFQANNVSLTVPMPIDWATLPKRPHDYKRIFHELFEVSSDQSLYQTLLPPKLQAHEFLQTWLKDETIPLVLERLSNARVLEIDAQLFNPLQAQSW